MIKVHHGNNELQVECSYEQWQELSDYFACWMPNAQFHPKVRAKMWDGKIRLFKHNRDTNTNTLPTGLIFLLRKFLQDHGYESNINEVLEKMSDRSITTDLVGRFIKQVKLNPQFIPHDYQLESVCRSLRNKRGIILSATGSGKSIVIYLVIRYLLQAKKNVLLIVPNTSLVEQMWANFDEYGWSDKENEASILYYGKELQTKPLLISTWQSVYKNDASFFKRFDAIIIDECHTVARSSSIADVCTKCVNAEYRLGFTGTNPKEHLDRLTVQAHLGAPLFTITSVELIEKDILSQVVIANLIVRYPDDVVENMKRATFKEEEDFVTSTPLRMQALDFIIEHIGKNENVLILCRRITHLHALRAYLQRTLPKTYAVYIVFKDIDAEERERIRKFADEHENVVIVGTFATMSTGVNIRRLHNVVFASSYKAKIKVVQSIGRGLRKHEEKEKLIVWDIVDDLSWWSSRGTRKRNYMLQHFGERLLHYKEQGFTYVSHKIDLKPTSK